MNSQKNLKGKVVSGLIWKFGERISAQLVSTTVSIILARLLDPSHYGIVTLVLVFINLANVFVTSSFGNALIQKKEVDNVEFSSVFFFNIIVSLVLYVILFISAPLIAAFYDLPELTLVIRVFSIRIPVAAVNSIQQAYVSRHMLFKRFFWSTLLGTAISGIVGIALAYRGFGVWALVAQYLTNTCVDTLVLWVTVRWRPDFVFSWKRISSLISYGWKLLVSSLIATGYAELRSLVIGKVYSSSDLAYYNQGDKYPKLIVNNINVSISGVLFPAISQIQDDRERMKQMTRKAIQVSSFLMWPLMIGMAVVSEPFVRLLLTEKWLPCVPFIRVFCLTYGLWPIHTANLEAIKAMGRSDIFLKLEIVKKVVGLITLLLAMPYGPFAIALSVIVSDLLSAVINAFPNVRLLQYSYWEQMGDILPPLGLSCVMAVALIPISMMNLSDFWTILIQAALGGCIYLLLSVITKAPALGFILSMLNKKRK